MTETWTDEEYYEEYYDDEYYDEAPRRGWSSLALAISGLIGIVVGFACAACLALVLMVLLFEGGSPGVVEGTDTSLTTSPSTAPPFEDIRSQMEMLTDIQWDQYAQQLEGAMATSWTGWVDDVDQRVSGEYELKIDMDPPEAALSVYDVSFIIPDDLAFQLQKDQQVTFSGQIVSVHNILDSLQIELVKATVEP